MKKKAIKLLFLLTVLSSQTYASSGYANDGLKFTICLVLFFLLIAGIFKGFDILRKHGRMIIFKSYDWMQKKFLSLKMLLRDIKSRYFELKYFIN